MTTNAFDNRVSEGHRDLSHALARCTFRGEAMLHPFTFLCSVPKSGKLMINGIGFIETVVPGS